jgi:hypothetical protein
MERLIAWRCIGCGRIDGPQPCVGVCQDRKVELVDAGVADALQSRIDALEAVLRQLALATPRAGEWQRSYLELQSRARQLLRA